MMKSPTNLAPDFNNLLKVLNREPGAKPVLFEVFMNNRLYSRLAGESISCKRSNYERLMVMMKAFYHGGYDYFLVPQWLTNTMVFPKDDLLEELTGEETDGVVIEDEKGFEDYPWPNPKAGDYDLYEKLGKELPGGMKILAHGPGGVFENVLDLLGISELQKNIIRAPEFVSLVFDAVGKRILEYYRILASIDAIGALVVDDDWGFKDRLLMEVPEMRKYVFPWHEKIVEVIHQAGKPAILHSCGNVNELFDAIIDELGYDAKHSFEDKIVPVEMAYQRWGKRIAILGGIDVDFLIKNEPGEIYKRSRHMLELASENGSYALGSGNSIPEYVPEENYHAMVKALQEFR